MFAKRRKARVRFGLASDRRVHPITVDREDDQGPRGEYLRRRRWPAGRSAPPRIAGGPRLRSSRSDQRLNLLANEPDESLEIGFVDRRLEHDGMCSGVDVASHGSRDSRGVTGGRDLGIGIVTGERELTVHAIGGVRTRGRQDVRRDVSDRRYVRRRAGTDRPPAERPAWRRRSCHW